jgi:hypothetical protein
VLDDTDIPTSKEGYEQMYYRFFRFVIEKVNSMAEAV